MAPVPLVVDCQNSIQLCPCEKFHGKIRGEKIKKTCKSYLLVYRSMLVECLYKPVLGYTNMLVEYMYIYIVWYVMSMNTACEYIAAIKFIFQKHPCLTLLQCFQCYGEVWDAYILVKLTRYLI